MGTGMGFGLIVANRGFFNKRLAQEGRAKIAGRMKSLEYEVIVLPESATPSGAIETVQDAEKCAAFFRQNREKIQGVVVTLPNFGDELGVVNALHLAKLDVPVLVHAEDDDLDRLTVDKRRDAFCGKLSVCNNLRQYGIPFTNTTFHTMKADGERFAQDFQSFAAVCRVVNGLRSLRVGAIGTRPAAFQTMRISEKLLQKYGVTVIPVDMSEIISAAQALDAGAAEVRAKLDEIRAYGRIPAGIRQENVTRQAKLSVVIERWMRENNVQAAGVQCWQSIQLNYGCAVCLTLSMLGEKLVPCACEVDIGGVVASYALTLASGNPAGFMDWNNNYGDDRDMCVFQHCSSLPRGFIGTDVEISNLSVMGSVIGDDVCFGAVKGKAVAGPFTYFRVSTDDVRGAVRCYIGQGELTDDPFDMEGGIAVCRIPRLQALMKHLCKQGFEHHVSTVRSHCASVIREAVETYLGWDLYVHE